MRASQIITLQIWNGSIWVDYTEGLISSRITRGIQQYLGPLTQPDAGVMTITSRNPNLDPYNNSDIKYNALIRINAAGERIFTGKIEGIDVDYKPKGKPAIITITAIDMIAVMHKHILSDSFLSTYEHTEEMINNLGSEISNYSIYSLDTDGIYYAHGHSSSGTTALNAVQIRSKTDLGFFCATARNEIKYLRRTKDDPLHPYNLNPSKITFDYSGAGESYQSISVSDGFEKIINTVNITGTQGATLTSTANDSVNLWGKSSATVLLQTNNATDLQTIANEILLEMSEPVREIYDITWNSMLDPDTAHNIDMLDNITIIHKINESTTINRKYSVIGINHEINADDWITTYKLRNFDYQTTSIANPVIVVTPQSGDTNTNFDVSWTHPNPELFTGVFWDLDDGFTSTNSSTTVNYDTNGLKTITLTATTIYGYTKIVSINISVIQGAPTATFTATYDANRVYTFTYTGDSGTTFLWNFGDGTTSTLQNPTKYYLPGNGGSKTITLTATNTIGSSQTSQTITVLELLKIPVRYVRINYTNVANSPDSFRLDLNSPSTTPYGNFGLTKMYRTGSTEILGWTVVGHEEYLGYLSNSGGTFDDYWRNKAIPSDTLTTMLKGSAGSVQPMRFTDTIANNSTTVIAQTIIDLGDEYFDFNKIQITKSSSSTNKGFGATLNVDVSRDQGVWYNFGYTTALSNSINSGFTYTTAGVTTPTYAGLPVATQVPDYTPIRYIRLVSNVPATSASLFRFNEIIVLAGNKPNVYDGTFTTTINGTTPFTGQKPINWTIGYGTLDETRRTGASISYPSQYNTGQIYYQAAGASPTPINSPAQLDVLNLKNTKNLVYWEESAGAKTLLLDLGRPMKKVSGIHFDMRNTTGGTTNLPTTNYKVTIYLSADGANWLNLGQFDLSSFDGATETGAITLSASSPIIFGTSTISKSYITASGTTPITP
jgi:hypothetical protein